MDGTHKLGGPPRAFPSPFLPSSSSDPTQKRPQVTSAYTSTTTTTTRRTRNDLHKTLKLGDFSSLDLYSIYDTTNSSTDHSASSISPESIQPASAENLSPATTTSPSSGERLPYNILKVPKLGDFSALESCSALYPPSQEVEYTDEPRSAPQEVHHSASRKRPLLGDFSKIFDTFGYKPSSKTTVSPTADMATTARPYVCPGARAKAARKDTSTCCWHQKKTHESTKKEADSAAQGKAADKNKAYVCPALRNTINNYNSPATTEQYDQSITAIIEDCLPPAIFPKKSGSLKLQTRKIRALGPDTDTDWRSGRSSASSSGDETDITTPPRSPELQTTNKRKWADKIPEARKIKKTDDIAFEYDSESGQGSVSFTKSYIQKHPRFQKNAVANETERIRDKNLATRLTQAKEDVHVFVDVSNVYISLLHTVRKFLDIPSAAKLFPNPEMDWEKLLQIVVRDRPVKTLSAGCSINPARRDYHPSFIQRLKEVGFEVDVLDRVEHEGRYVEKLVDETIQAHIGDTVKDTEKPGTIVIVTGDGRPAPQSAGFKAYAEHALKQGWNVEVVCWTVGCSQLWKDESWRKFGLRYRLINLDDYVGELFVAKK